MRTYYDAIVIGAGPAGSSAAILLAQAGWTVALIEKESFPRRKVCGECIAASNLPLFDALGIGHSFSALAGPALRQVVLMHGRQSICAELPQAQARHPWGRALGREHLDPLLLQRAAEAGAHVLQPWTVRAITGGPGAFGCTLENGESRDCVNLESSVLIGAHGSWTSNPSAQPEAERVQRASDLFAFKANFLHARLDTGLLPVLAFAGGYGGMVVGEHGITTLACCIRRDRLQACRREFPGMSAGEAVENFLMRECAGVGHALRGAMRQGRWLGIGPIKPGIRMPRDGGDRFLVGNAAGEAHPIIGEGISMALQSAWLLCEYLKENPGVRSDAQLQRKVLRDYAVQWRAHFARRIHLAAAFAHLAMRPAVGSVALPLLRAWPALMTHAARWSGKVDSPAGTVVPAESLGTTTKAREFY